jgi:hypothetical protein
MWVAILVVVAVAVIGLWELVRPSGGPGDRDEFD